MMIVEISNQRLINKLNSNNGLIIGAHNQTGKLAKTSSSIRLNDKNGINNKKTNDIFTEKNSDLLKLHKLSKQSQRNMEFTAGKNKQEENRLSLYRSVLNKNYDYEDNNWFREFMNIKKSLENLKETTTSLLLNESSMNNDYESTMSCFMTKSSKNKFNQNQDTATTSQYTKSSKCFSISRFYDKTTRLNAEFYKVNCKSQNADCIDDDNLDYNSSYDYNCSMVSNKFNSHSVYSSHVLDPNQRCNLFPCTLLKSYTSMVGPQSDKTQKQLENLCFKSSLSHTRSNTAITTNTINTTNTENTSKSKKSVCIQDGNYSDTDSEYYEINQNKSAYVDSLNSNKSIRRPLRRAGSSKDVMNKLKSLQTKVKYVREQNAQTVNTDDRNIRYGDPAPKRKT